MCLKNRAVGSLLGLGIGDAMGAPIEFRDRGTFELVKGFRSGGPFNLEAGFWTDDTAMALCLANSLIDREGIDQEDQMKRYLRWIEEGYMSSTGKAVGVGQTVLSALLRYYRTSDPKQGLGSPKYSGNGCIMRLAPVPIFYHSDPKEAVLSAIKSAEVTHASPQSLQITAYFSGLLWAALNGASKDVLAQPYFNPVDDFEFSGLHEDSEIVLRGDYMDKAEEDLQPTGYVCHSLEVALWSFFKTDTYEEGLIRTVNLGGDADTTGAIYGQLAGAYYGFQSLPESWVRGLYNNEYIEQLAKMSIPDPFGH